MTLSEAIEASRTDNGETFCVTFSGDYEQMIAELLTVIDRAGEDIDDIHHTSTNVAEIWETSGAWKIAVHCTQW